MDQAQVLEELEALVKEGKENNLLDLITADASFDVTKEELKSVLEPEKYIGLSNRQVEEYLEKEIAPLIHSHRLYTGIKGRIEC